ncbi:VOC family protein [Kocuria tytonis]|uniref:VOC family protein n=1 Tax=Kocuria tytonis TaxID=2054280 RepID=A0A495A5A9_9MICC|nr:VOC family protein [Kocuria tytonis]RKQ34988.1 VOC family protein [Kocuria tytonis]
MRLYAVVIDCRNLHAQAHWWAEALDWVVVQETAEEAGIAPRASPTTDMDDRSEFDSVQPAIWFFPVPEPKTVKNRIHLDFAPHVTEDWNAVVERFLAAGARRVDVGQPEDATFAVLADPEDNEFCILSARRS